MDIISIILAAWLGFGISSSDIPLPKDESVYKLISIPVHEIAWDNNVDKWHKLTQIAIQTPTEYTYVNNFKIQEPAAVEEKGLKIQKDSTVLEVTSDSKLDVEKYFCDSNNLYSVFFPIESAEPLMGSYERFMKFIPNGSKVAIRGYASPDGKNPEQQYNLAVKRAEYIKKALHGKAIFIEYYDAKVCGLSDFPSSCWRVDVKLLMEE